MSCSFDVYIGKVSRYDNDVQRHSVKDPFMTGVIYIVTFSRRPSSRQDNGDAVWKIDIVVKYEWFKDLIRRKSNADVDVRFVDIVDSCDTTDVAPIQSSYCMTFNGPLPRRVYDNSQCRAIAANYNAYVILRITRTVQVNAQEA